MNHNVNNHHKMMVKDFRKRFWICFFITLPILIFSPTIQQFFGLEIKFFFDKYLLLFFSSVIYFYGAWPFLKGFIKELKKFTPGMMTLVSIAVTIAYLYSFFVTLNFISGAIFFWEVATLIDVMLLGHWIEMKSVLGASKSLEKLVQLLPAEVHLLLNGQIKDIKLKDLSIGDKIIIKPGERIPADGIIIEGDSELDESAITGESKPIYKTKKDFVIGGSLNINGSIVVKIQKTGKNSYISKVIELVNQASFSKSRAQSIADKVALWLTIIAIFAGVLTFVIWLSLNKTFSFSLERMVTVMVITCPHALGLAIPLVIAVITTIAAKNGFLIRNRIAFEKSRKVNVVIFDKTGTLTTGSFGVTDIICFKDCNKNELLKMAADVEINSEHSIAKSIVKKAEEKKINIEKAKKFKALLGKGAQGFVGNKLIFVGSFGELKKEKSSFHINKEEIQKIEDIINDYTKQGKTVVVVATENEIKGIIVLSDIIRSESKKACRLLKKQNIKIVMITGDDSKTANNVAKKLNIDKVFARVLPDQKAEKVKLLQEKGNFVAMVGDGINDAPALAQADLGIAIGAGTDIAAETADIILVNNDPRNIDDILNLSHIAYNKMIQNLVWATGYNLITIPIAAGVLYKYNIILPPSIGAAIMSLSTIIVAFNARFISFKKY